MKNLIKKYKEFYKKLTLEDLILILELQEKMKFPEVELEWFNIETDPEIYNGEPFVDTEWQDTSSGESWNYSYSKEELVKIVARNRAMKWGVNPDKFTWWWYNS